MPEPRPAYNTVSTIVRILEKKGFVNHLTFGKSHLYYPVISKKEYTRSFLQRFVNNYFEEGNLSVEEMEEIRKIIKENIRNKR